MGVSGRRREEEGGGRKREEGVSYRLRWKLRGLRLGGLRLNFLGVGCYQEKL